MQKIINSVVSAIEKTGEAIDRNVTSKEELLEKSNELKTTLTNASKEIAIQDAKGNWMQRSWRPLSGLAFVLIILYNKFLAVAFGFPVAELEPEFWNLFQIVLGVFGFTRGVEKSVKAAHGMFKKKKASYEE